MESKMENPTDNFREMKHVVQLIYVSRVGAPERKKSRLFVTFILSEEILLTFVIFSLYTMH